MCLRKTAIIIIAGAHAKAVDSMVSWAQFLGNLACLHKNIQCVGFICHADNNIIIINWLPDSCILLGILSWFDSPCPNSDNTLPVDSNDCFCGVCVIGNFIFSCMIVSMLYIFTLLFLCITISNPSVMMASAISLPNTFEYKMYCIVYA